MLGLSEFGFEGAEGVVELVEGGVKRHFVGADKLGDVALVVRGEAFFEGVDAVALLGFVRQGLEAVEVVALKLMFSRVFNHVPLD